MKKVLLSVMTVVTAFVLAACQGASKQESTEQTYTATLKVTFADDKVSEEKVTFEKDDSVMDILEEHYKVEETDGLVTSIDGVSQDAAKNTYWMYDVNGELAPKGAKEMHLSDGDTVAFYLETFK